MHNLLHSYVREALGSRLASLHAAFLDTYNSASRPWHEVANDGYLYDHLAHHLCGARRDGELKSLFATDRWMEARFALSHTHVGFLNDLTIAWRDAAQPSAYQQIERGEDPTALADCVRYALLRATIHSLAGAYPPSLVVRAVEIELWAADRAMSVAATVLDAEARAKMYVGLLETGKIEGDLRSTSTVNALAAIERMPNSSAGDKDPRIALLRGVAQFLDARGIERALAIVASGAEGISRWYGLLALAHVLEVDRLEALLAVDLNASLNEVDPAMRADNLERLSPHLRGDDRQRALKAWLETAPTLPEVERIEGMGDYSPRGSALEALSGELDGKDLAQALDLTAALGNEWGQLGCIKVLATRAPAGELPRLLELAISLRDERYRVDALTALALRLDSEGAERAGGGGAALDES